MYPTLDTPHEVVTLSDVTRVDIERLVAAVVVEPVPLLDDAQLGARHLRHVVAVAAAAASLRAQPARPPSQHSCADRRRLSQAQTSRAPAHLLLSQLLKLVTSTVQSTQIVTSSL